MPQAALPDAEIIFRDVETALAEDLGSGDCTASLIPARETLVTRVICRQHAVLAGQAWFDETFRQLDELVRVEWTLRDGDRMTPELEICRLQGPARSILRWKHIY